MFGVQQTEDGGLTMANQNESAQELLLDVRVAEASRFYKFYQTRRKKSSVA
jgi:hypothetical protein